MYVWGIGIFNEDSFHLVIEEGVGVIDFDD
jgi:hypothetical protein